MPTFPQISFVIALSLLSSSAFATSYYQEEIDEDYEKILSKKFLIKIDANNDKKISFDELLAYKTKKTQQRLTNSINALFNRCDKNKDDKIDKTEVVKVNVYSSRTYYGSYNTYSAPQRCAFNIDRLNAYDTNEDGVLDRSEAEGAVSYRPNKKLRKKQQSQEKKRQNRQAKESFKRCDKDSDQQLSLREAASMDCNMVTEQFDAHDKNKDGYLSLKERLLNIKYSDYAKPKKPKNQYASNYKPYTLTPLDILQSSFYSCDKNTDGRLAKAETASKECVQELWFFNQTDRDDDGFISNKELQTAILKQSFDAMDNDKNGLLEGKEFKGSKVRYL
ncbi:MAG TPA: hypothetical protein EYG68_01095 [Leucothrix mucor]|nr:hypothetical protein [Leucothrix mucor]